MQIRTLAIWYMVLIIVLACEPSTPSKKTYYNLGSNAWHIEQWAPYSYAFADYEGNVFVRDVKKEANIWTYPAGAFVFDLKTADLDYNGKTETAFVTASGDLKVLDDKGELLWSFQSDLALFNVVTGNFTGDEHLEIAAGGLDRYVYVFDHKGNLLSKSPEAERLVHRLEAGNLNDDDKYDEILMIENRTIANLLSVRNDSVISIWRKPLTVPEELVNWENPNGRFFAFSLDIDDLDGDGDQEIILGDTYFNKQSVMVTDHEANSLWISEGLPPFEKVDNAQVEFYSTAFVRSAELDANYPGKEIISVAGGMFRLWANDGTLISKQNCKVGFTDFLVEGNDLLLNSSPNGDTYMYRVNMDNDWQKQVAGIQYKGIIQEIKANTDSVFQLVEKYQPRVKPSKKYDLIVGFGSVKTNDNGLQEHQKQIEWFGENFPYENLRVIKTLKIIENEPPLDETGKPWNPRRWSTDAIRGTSSVQEILAQAKWIEDNKIPTMFNVGHSCMPFISLSTAEKILQVAPKYCLGFYTAEDEDVDDLPRYFQFFFKPLADLCLKYGNKQCQTKNKGLWWMSSPAFPEVFSAMFEKGRDEVSMAATEDSNSRTPEINLMGRGGLWQAGLLKHNDVSVHGDLFSFNRYQQWEYPKAGHPYLRLLLAHTTLGMTQLSVRTRREMPESQEEVIETMGRESAGLIYHLLGKGVLFSPDPDEAMGYSPLGLVIHKPTDKWLDDAHNGHTPEIWQDDKELHQAVFPHNGNPWGMTNTPEHAFTKVVFDKQRQFGYQMPATPYGLVAMVPEHADLTKVSNVKQWLHTDGIYIWREGSDKLTGQEAANFIKKEFESAAANLAFRQVADKPVFMQVLRTGDNQYRLFMVDPGWVNPSDHSISIKIQIPGNFSVAHTLTGNEIPVKSNMFNVKVPAGLFTIVDVVQNDQ